VTSGTPTRMAAWLESAWLARYLDRQLEGEELAWFEGYLLDKPELVEAVEAENLLKGALAASEKNSHARPTIRLIGRGLAPSRRYVAAAAMLCIGVGIGAVVHYSGNDAVYANPTRVVLDTLRGEAEIPRVEQRASPGPVIFEVAVPPDAQAITLRISGRDDAHLVISADGFVSFLISRSEIRRVRVAQIEYSQDSNHIKKTIDLMGTIER